MTTHVVKTETDLAALFAILEKRKRPFTVNVLQGAHRTDPQNKLQRLWCAEIAQQMGDQTPEDVRGYCKLRIGVPIMRENDDFRERYDEIIRPLPYEQKLALMMEPFDFAVTRKMTTEQKTRYLDQMNQHFAEQGVMLTQPEERR